jgi:hypothetical protein
LLKAKKYTEFEFTDQVLKLARLHGWRTAHFRPARTATGSGWRTAVSGDGKGFPDLVLVRKHRLVVAELKVGINQPTPEQEQWLEAFRRAGAEVYVWRPEDWSAIEYLLSRTTNHHGE